MLETGKRIAIEAQKRGWQVFVVGGFVRDMVVSKASKDLDLEVFGPESVEELVGFLSEFGEVNAVGKSFGVLKLRVDGVDLDVSLPRTESKEGRGHKGFVVKSDGALTPRQASLRRDFTFNALMLSLPGCQIVDFFNGQSDLLNKRLHHTSVQFSDDPLRVLRGMQFCGRFDLTAEKDTVQLCRSLLPEFETLAKERIWIEFEKWAAKSVKPSRGLVFLLRSGWIAKFPELNAIAGVKQGAKHHPEGSVWQHTKMVVDQAAKIAERENLSRDDRVVLVLSALCHDLGKVITTEVQSDLIVSSVGHEIESERLAKQFLEAIDAPKGVVKKVCKLARWHMAKVNTKHAVRRLANRLDCVSVKMLTLLIEADINGRKVQNPNMESVNTILEIAQELKVENEKPSSILMGRHLIELGMKPGKHFGVILNEAFEAQLNGEFETLEQAKIWLAQNL
jgi:tRNA nucleotidyltransferase (CCA-adding enzyme)